VLHGWKTIFSNYTKSLLNILHDTKREYIGIFILGIVLLGLSISSWFTLTLVWEKVPEIVMFPTNKNYIFFIISLLSIFSLKSNPFFLQIIILILTAGILFLAFGLFLKPDWLTDLVSYELRMNGYIYLFGLFVQTGLVLWTYLNRTR
jgi:hypothetical protein